MSVIRFSTIAVLFASVSVLTACQPQSNGTTPAPSTPDTVVVGEQPDADDPERDHDAPSEGTTATTEHVVERTGNVVLEDVRIAARNGYERIVFDFGDESETGHLIRYSSQATECGSGYPVELEGSAVLEVSFSPAAAHRFEDEQRVSTLEIDHLEPVQDLIREARMTCDHHGGVTWAFGLSAEAPYAVSTLTDPQRVVVDVSR